MAQYKNTTLQQLLLIVIIILLAILIAAMWLQKHHMPLTQAEAVSQQQTSTTFNTPAAKSAETTPGKKIAEQPVDFDFYKLLAEQKATAIASAKKQIITTLPAKAAKIAAPTQSYYILQIAATHNLAVAMEFKQHLGTLGYIAVVQSFEHQQQLWYRVLIGPYPNKAAAAQVQQRLGRQKMTSLLIPIKNPR